MTLAQATFKRNLFKSYIIYRRP